MTSNPEYKTTNSGMIDYQHYIHRGHEIRSQDAWRGICKVGKALKAVAPTFRKTAKKKQEPLPQEPVRTQFGEPRIRQVRIVASGPLRSALVR